MNNKFKYIIVFTILNLVGFAFIQFGIAFQKNNLPTYSYKAIKNNDYEVVLKPNDFYPMNPLPSGSLYASQAIDSFILDFKYQFDSNKQETIEYNYNITANLVGINNATNEQNQEIWNRNFILLDNNYNTNNADNSFSVDRKITINYEYYNNLVNSFEKAYDLSLYATLQVRFNIYYTIKFSDVNLEDVKVNDYIEMDIPLTNTVTQINNNYENVTSQDFLDNDGGISIYEIICFIIGTFCFLLNIPFIITKYGLKSPEKIYYHKLSHILSSNKELIVIVKNQPVLENLDVIYVNSIEDLINIAEQSRCNIIYYELIKNKKSNFYVIFNNYAYIYELLA